MNPNAPPTYIVCPSCKTDVKLDPEILQRAWCQEHGSVVPMKSAVVNRVRSFPGAAFA